MTPASSIYNLYPDSFTYELEARRQHYEGTPIVPFANINEIIAAVHGLDHLTNGDLLLTTRLDHPLPIIIERGEEYIQSSNQSLLQKNIREKNKERRQGFLGELGVISSRNTRRQRNDGYQSSRGGRGGGGGRGESSRGGRGERGESSRGEGSKMLSTIPSFNTEQPSSYSQQPSSYSQQPSSYSQPSLPIIPAGKKVIPLSKILPQPNEKVSNVYKVTIPIKAENIISKCSGWT